LQKERTQYEPSCSSKQPTEPTSSKYSARMVATSSATVECPICEEQFPRNIIEQYAATCKDTEIFTIKISDNEDDDKQNKTLPYIEVDPISVFDLLKEMANSKPCETTGYKIFVFSNHVYEKNTSKEVGNSNSFSLSLSGFITLLLANQKKQNENISPYYIAYFIVRNFRN